MRTFASSIVLGAILAAPALADKKLAMHVSPRIALEPATLVVETIIERSTENRALQISVESESYYLNSVVELDGDRAPRVATSQYPHVPGGTYVVHTVLFGPGGKVLASDSRTVEVLARH